ncbi:MAG: hypothetical protein H7Y43_09930 [Akkermansiaceae bacterium]|nr:hypothetical protein [Verrucomicrobiales bacterium]
MGSQIGGFLPSFFERNVTHHESHRELEPGRNAESALQSAAHQLGRTASTGGGAPASQRRVLQGRQERDLEIWAKANGGWLSAAEALEGFVKGGEEHRTLRGGQIYHKATYSGRYGFTVIAANGQPTLTNALPGEYLSRLLLANEIFGDDIRLEGVTRESDGLVILTSQPTVVGTACDREEMIGYFEARHFALIPDFSAGYRGSLSFYRDLDQIAVFDAHPANFLRDRSGIILPIDAVLLRADDELAGLLEYLLDP